MVIELGRRVQHTQIFLRMAALELRRIAEQAPDVAVQLQHVAQQLEAEEEDLALGGHGKTGQKNQGNSRGRRRREGQCSTLSK
jgi:hypothetical protein